MFGTKRDRTPIDRPAGPPLPDAAIDRLGVILRFGRDRGPGLRATWQVSKGSGRLSRTWFRED